ncbi:hypothetical protein H257_12713 [Aphanomyces astaci]|uniref:Uncharacterized protein n=1 Tax=Aphanomyces astaci TaxID=112090 RepID=W4FZZ6_APHAT|nr:hypothetical protein H257_12713 [Aphanomyces astaci]ETV72248.1 hypothetical protein H257_12713 [Aphanomyces astaci]|eukprot:XP_009838316.1 hypothetical protein H257_12713 [Aphanomyces astaci]
MQALFSFVGLLKLVLRERERKKYAFVVYLVHCLHYLWAAKRPTLTHQDTSTTRQILRSCRRLGISPCSGSYLQTHLQTLMVALSVTAPTITYDRQLLTLSDRGTVSLDWAIPTTH